MSATFPLSPAADVSTSPREVDAPRDVPAVALFASSASTRAEVRAQLPLEATVVSAGTWALSPSAASAVDCVVVVWTAEDEQRRELAPVVRAIADVRRAPVVACADLTARGRAELARAGAAAVVAPGVPPWALWGEVQRAVSGSLLARTAARLDEVRLGDELRAVLTALCVEDPPPATITALCAAIGAHRRTVWYQWRQRLQWASRPRFEDVVTTAVLLRAFMCRARGASWAEVADHCGVHRHTLARNFRRLLGIEGVPPFVGERADAGHAAARRAFAENVVRPVFRKHML